MEDLLTKLSAVQQHLKAPKGQRNSFGNYNYRSAEDILEAVKPLLFEHGLVMTISDSIVHMSSEHKPEQITYKNSKGYDVTDVIGGDRFYVEATVTVYNSTNSIYTTGVARESQYKAGMDDSQITGTASSYARKYALNGMFDIDDTKDADTDEYSKQVKSAPKATEVTVKKGVLEHAKDDLNKQLEAQDYTTPDSKRAFIKDVLGKVTITTIDDAEAVADALDNEK